MRSCGRSRCKLCHPWKFGICDEMKPSERRQLQDSAQDQIDGSIPPEEARAMARLDNCVDPYCDEHWNAAWDGLDDATRARATELFNKDVCECDECVGK